MIHNDQKVGDDPSTISIMKILDKSNFEAIYSYLWVSIKCIVTVPQEIGTEDKPRASPVIT